MPIWLIVLFLSSGALALGALVQLAVSWRHARMRLPKGGAGAVVFGSRICLVCWSYVLLVRSAVSANFFEHLPLAVSYPLGALAYWAILAAAGGILISAVGGAAWMIRSIVVGRTS